MEWFPEDGLDLTRTQSEFLTALRDRATAWDNDPECGAVFVVSDVYPFLRIVFDVIDKDRNVTMLCVGAYFTGDRAVFGQMNSDDYSLLDHSVVQKEGAFGAAAELGLSVARWIEGLLKRPFIYRECTDLPGGSLRDWALADSQVSLVATGSGYPPKLNRPNVVNPVIIR